MPLASVWPPARRLLLPSRVTPVSPACTLVSLPEVLAVGGVVSRTSTGSKISRAGSPWLSVTRSWMEKSLVLRAARSDGQVIVCVGLAGLSKLRAGLDVHVHS